MKKQIVLVLGLILLVNSLLVLSPSVKAYNPFNTVVSGDQLLWKVCDYNETNNLDDPADWWRMSDFSFQGEYELYIGDIITFTVDNPNLGNGSLEIGNLTLASASRSDFSFNLNLFSAFPPSFTPGLLASTNWTAQIEAANNTLGTMMIQTTHMTFCEEVRAVIAFYYVYGDQISNAIYDNETGILLSCYTKFGDFWLGLDFMGEISSEIPSFEIFFIISVLSAVVILALVKKKMNSIPSPPIEY
jgi:hypothetical protein